jgi:DNA modification methylase
MSELPINEIICGDCLEVMKDWPDNSVDLVLTDPPYGTVDGRGKVVQSGDGLKVFNPGSWDETLPLDYIGQAIRVLRAGSWFCIFTDNLSVKAVWDACEDAGGRGKQTFHWIKPICPQPRKNFCSTVETAIVGTKGAVQRWFGGGATANSYCTPRALWDDVRAHPTQKPLRLLWYLAVAMSDADDLILDPFCGSGTTCVAAKKLGRKYIGIDISEKYCQIARDRLKAVDTGVPVKEARKGQKALFE